MSNENVYTHSNHPAFIYQEMLADQYRMQCYRRAIEQTVSRGDIVADLGTGTGVLAIMAIQAGAKHAYAIEVRPHIIPITKKIIKDNGMSSQITVIEGDARTVNLPSEIDVLINELIGDYGTDENILECVKAIANKHLKPTGKIIPQRLKTYLVPIKYNDEYQGIWTKDFQGIDLSSVSQISCKEEAQMRILSHVPTELSAPCLIEDINFESMMVNRPKEHQVDFSIHTKSDFHGFLGFFVSDLTQDVQLNNYPGYPGCHWQTWHWPVYPLIQVNKGTKLHCQLTTPENMLAQSWSLTWSIEE